MKKISILLSIFALGTPLSGQGLATALETPQNTLEFDMSYGIHAPVFETQYENSYGTVSTTTRFNVLRAGFDGTTRFIFSDWLSLGANLGLYSLELSPYFDSSEVKADVPVRLLVRVGYSGVNIEPHIGYLFSTTALGGVEVGVKANLMLFYADYSTVIGTYRYTRAGIGFQLDKLFSF